MLRKFIISQICPSQVLSKVRSFQWLNMHKSVLPRCKIQWNSGWRQVFTPRRNSFEADAPFRSQFHSDFTFCKRAYFLPMISKKASSTHSMCSRQPERVKSGTKSGDLRYHSFQRSEDLQLSFNLHLPSILFTTNIVSSHFLRRDRDLHIS